jgi:hypothetical protein
VKITSRAAASARVRLVAMVAAAAVLGFLANVGPGVADDGDKSGPVPIQSAAAEISARTIDRFDRANPERQRFGRLRFKGGLVLTSSAKAFGGYSAIAIEPDGRHFVAISDEGTWLTGDITYDGTRPKDIVNARLGPLTGLKGRLLDRKHDLDAESLALLDGTLAKGTVLIGFERNHRIGRFPISAHGIEAPTGYLKLTPETRRMRANNGFEAMAILSGGAFRGSVVAFSERLLDVRNNHTGWIWLNGEPQRLSLTNIGDFDVTDLAPLPDGSLIVLERRFRMSEGVKMRLRLIKAVDVRPAALLGGEVLFEADSGYEIDNMEGVAIHRGPNGETVLTLISDDNFNHLLQRTLLLQFELAANAQAATGTAVDPPPGMATAAH